MRVTRCCERLAKKIECLAVLSDVIPAVQAWLQQVSRHSRFYYDFSQMPGRRRGWWFCGSERQFNPAWQEAQSI
jgi:hypothetical protein